MLKNRYLNVLLMFLFSISTLSASPVRTVPYVDIKKYSGTWFEISKIPNPFQKDCRSMATAEYQIRSDGLLTVINSCTKADNSKDQVQGVAQIIENSNNAKLKVSFVNLFGLWFFWGDYWIIGLDSNYTYAIVGTPDRKYGWVLARKKELSLVEKTEILSILKAQGYNPGLFEPAL